MSELVTWTFAKFSFASFIGGANAVSPPLAIGEKIHLKDEYVNSALISLLFVAFAAKWCRRWWMILIFSLRRKRKWDRFIDFPLGFYHNFMAESISNFRVFFKRKEGKMPSSAYKMFVFLLYSGTWSSWSPFLWPKTRRISGLVIQLELSYVTLLTADRCPQEGRAQFNYRKA